MEHGCRPCPGDKSWHSEDTRVWVCHCVWSFQPRRKFDFQFHVFSYYCFCILRTYYWKDRKKFWCLNHKKSNYYWNRFCFALGYDNQKGYPYFIYTIHATTEYHVPVLLNSKNKWQINREVQGIISWESFVAKRGGMSGNPTRDYSPCKPYSLKSLLQFF